MHGINGKLLKWIKSFLEARLMRVGIRGRFSDWIVLSGVPQGSVLGPLLFLLFVNDLPDWIKNSMRMFADDVKIWNVIRTDAGDDSLQEDLNSLARWSSKWLLKLNSSKCKVMHIGHDTYTEYHITDDDSNSNVIEQITEEKDLGVYITADLKPSRPTQCVRAAAKARSVMGMVRRNLIQETRQRRFLVDIQNVHPASYGVLRPGMVTVLKERHRVLRKGSKIISNKDGAWTSIVTCLMSRDCGTWS